MDTVRAVEIEGHTSIRSARVELRAVNLLIGANGAGKSNFIRALELLGVIADGRLAPYVMRSGGAGYILNQSIRARQLRLGLEASSVSYDAILGSGADGGLYFEHESWSSVGAHGNMGGINRSGGYQETLLRKTRQGVPDVMSEAAQRVLSLLRGCRIYHFHDTSRTAPVKQSGPTADSLMLRSDAANLAALLAKLRNSGFEQDAVAYRRIVSVVNQVAPFFDDFVLAPDERDSIRLRWHDNTEGVFSAHQMSDGTLRFICLATLLLSPTLPQLVVLDEPELGLHPSAIVQLAELLRSASTRSQVLVATQSVTLLNQFEPEDLVVVERSDDGTTLRRPDPAVLESWLEDYAVGELWEKNIIGGRPGGAGRSLT